MNLFPTMGDEKIAMRLFETAASMDAKVKERLNYQFSGNYTYKRATEAEEARREGARLQQIQRVLLRLAEDHKSNCVPFALQRVNSRRVVEHLLLNKGYPEPNGVGGWWDKAVPTYRKMLHQAAIFKNTYDEAREIVLMYAENDPETLKKLDAQRREMELRGKVGSYPGFFPTPKPVAEMLIGMIPVHESARYILEPSAGAGDLAKVLEQHYPDATIHVMEINDALREHLETEKWHVIGRDFLKVLPKPDPMYDIVAQNPPFENGQDIEHVMHAYYFLRPGGWLVSIMAPGPFFRKDKQSVAFREWFEKVGGIKEDLPRGAFRKSGTNISAVMVRIQRAKNE